MTCFRLLRKDNKEILISEFQNFFPATFPQLPLFVDRIHVGRLRKVPFNKILVDGEDGKISRILRL